jgi:hypothetical protein
LWLGDSVKKAIDAGRIHHQLIPNTLQYENGLLKVSLLSFMSLSRNSMGSEPGSLNFIFFLSGQETTCHNHKKTEK